MRHPVDMTETQKQRVGVAAIVGMLLIALALGTPLLAMALLVGVILVFGAVFMLAGEALDHWRRR